MVTNPGRGVPEGGLMARLRNIWVCALCLHLANDGDGNDLLF